VRSSRDAGGLLSHLFSVRTRGLFGELSAAQLPSYLSGLLIGHELNGLLAGARHVHLIGSEVLVQRYRRALALCGVDARLHGEALAARGLYRLALAARLTSAA
jgi:2-dehydro-3-deoxygalactonokinase